MTSPDYPYATFEKDGFQLAVVEHDSVARVLAAPLPPDEERFAAKPGDLVKLVFEYKEPMKARGSGVEFGAEHMWVKIADFGSGCLVGALDSSPQYTKLLNSGDAVALHPKHIIAFWRDEKNGG